MIPLHPIDSVAERNRLEPLPPAQDPHSTSPSRIIADIEVLFARNRNLELALQDEKNRSKQTNDDLLQNKKTLLELQAQHEKLETAFKTNREHFQSNYLRFNQLKAAHLIERTRRIQLEEQLELLKRDKDRLHRYQEELETIRNEFFQLQRSEKNLKIEINGYLDQIKTLSEERRKLELERKASQLENDSQKTMRDLLKEQQTLLGKNLESLQSKHDSSAAEGAQLKRQNHLLLAKLQQYQTAWASLKKREEAFNQCLVTLQNQEMTAKELKRILAEEKLLRSQAETSLASERAQRNQAQALVNQEKDEKVLALKILHEVQARLSNVLNELETLKEKPHTRISQRSVPLDC